MADNPFLESSRPQGSSVVPMRRDNPFLESSANDDGQAIVRASSFAPDAYANARKLSESTGVPADVLARNPDEAKRVELRQRMQRVRERNPALADWLTGEPHRLTLAQDDIDNLDLLTHAVQAALNPYTLPVQVTDWARGLSARDSADLARSVPAGATQGIGMAVGGVGELYNLGERTIDRGVRALGLPDFDRNLIPRALRPGDAFIDTGAALDRVAGAVGAPQERQNMATGIASGVGQMAPMAAQAIYAPQTLFPSTLGMGASETAARVRQAGAYGSASGDFAIGSGALAIGLLERLGIERVVNRLPANVRDPVVRFMVDAGAGGLAEGGTEALQQVAGNAIIAGTIDPTQSLGEGVVDSGIQGGGAAAILRAALGLPGVPASRRRQAAEEMDRLLRSNEGALALQRLSDLAAQQKLAQSSPDDLRSLVRAAGGDGNVYLDAEQARVLFQSEPALLADIVGPELDLQAASGDIVIPLDQYVARVAQLPNAAEIARHVRARAEDVSLADVETIDFDALAQQLGLEDTTEAAERAEPGTVDARQQVVQDVMGQLIATGRYTPAAAEKQAKIWGAAMDRLATMAGTDAFSLYQRHMGGIGTGPNVQATRPWQGDGRLDALLDAIRSTGETSPRAVSGPSLVEFLRSEGGIIDDGGELRGMDAARLRPGLVNSAGMPLDRAREIVAEAGYFGDDTGASIGTTTISDLLDLIDRDLRSGDVFSVREGNRARQEFEAERDRLLAAIDEHPVLSAMPQEEFRALTNQQIADMLFGGSMMDQSALNFDQPSDPAQFDESAFRPAVVSWANGTYGDAIAPNGRPVWQNFVAWFGDSQAVDSAGAPLVVYHGSPDARFMGEDATFMSLNDRYGAREGVGVFWFAKDRGTASTYADDRRAFDYQNAESGIIPAYLKLENPLIVDGGGQAWRDAQQRGKTSDVIEEAQAGGYDGVIIRNVRDDYTGFGRGQERRATDTYVVFNSRQIKAAEGNSGDFGPSNPSILNQSAVDYMGDHRAPTRSSGAPAHDLAADGFYPDDVYSRNGPLYYGTGSEHDAQAFRIVAALRGKPDEMVSIFRAVPLDAGDDFNVGDWVAITRGYAVDHGDSVHGDDGYKVISKLVRAADIYTNGDSIQEWGYDPESEPQTLFQRAADAVRRVFNQQPSAKGPRGQIQVFPDRRMSISLFETADRSSFLHESAHFFFEVYGDIAAMADADPRAKADFDKLLQWGAIEGDSAEARLAAWQGMDINARRSLHEKVARGFEAYLMEGKAPSADLRSVFASFKAWLLSIYKSIQNLDVDLNDDIRGVFDRMLATDEEIEAAQVRQGFEPMQFPEGEAGQLGLTEKQFADYAAMVEAATEEARAEVTAKLMAAHDRAARRWYKEETANVRAEVEAEFGSQPVFRAARVLAGGRAFADGTPVPEALQGMKLDRAALVDVYGEDYLKRLPKLYAREGGVDQDAAAAVLGFPSGDALVVALANRGDLQARVKAETQARMRERHGDPMTDGTLAEVAMDAVHNDARVKLLQRELDMLADLAGNPRVEVRMLTGIARARMEGTTRRNIRPNDYLAAERRAAREATNAAAKGNYAEALLAKRKQALNASLFREARRAQENFDKTVRYLRRLEGRRAKIGKAGHDYLEQIDALLEGLEIREVSGAAVGRRQRLADWVAKQEAAGNPINVPQKLLDEAGLTNIRDMPLADLRDVVDTIKQIEHLAKTKNDLQLAGEKRDRIEVDNEMAASVAANHDAKPERTGDKTWAETAKQRLGDLDVQRLLPTNIARELDGYKEGGAVWTNVIKPIRDALYGKVNPAMKSMQEAVAAIYHKHYSKAEMSRLDSPVFRPEVGDNWSKGRILSLAMNWGSEGNAEAILSQDHSRLTEEQVAALLGKLDARDYAFAQDMVDLLNSYWPVAAEAKRRRSGVVPPKVEARPYSVYTADGQNVHFRGGYMRLYYDSERSSYGTTQQEIDDVYNDLRVGRSASAATKNGAMNERVGSAGKTVDLSLDSPTRAMRELIRDVYLGDAVAYVHTVMKGHAFTKAAIAAGKRDHLKALDLWLKDVAASEMGPKNALEHAVRFARQNTTAAVLAWKVTTAGLQTTGLIQTATVIGRRRTMRGVSRLLGKSWVGPNSIWQDIKSKSAYMEERFGKIPDAVQIVSDARDGRIKAGHAAMIRYGYIPMARMQSIADAATWLAGESYGLELFDGDVAKARDYADDLVIRAQSPENFIDKPAVSRGTLDEKHRQSELVKSTTMLLSYMIAKGNVAREKYQLTNFTSPKEAAKFSIDMVQLFALETIIMALFTNGLPDDEDDDGLGDDWAKYIASEVALGNLATIPLLSQLATEGRGYTAQGVMERTWGAVDNAGDRLIDGEWNEKDAKALINLAGVATGIPSSQINTTADALWRVRDGEDVSPIEYLIRQEKPRD